jgi:NAD(P)-dependent dehydrogenase (short-subunit alcohol dehydrogenase family)
MIDLNTKGLMFQSQAFVRAVRARGDRGHIINMAPRARSSRTWTSRPTTPRIAGVAMLTRSLALHLAKFGIRVNGIALIQTPGVRAMDDPSTANVDQIIQRVPLQRLGEADDIAKIALFLVSDASSYLTGSIVVADGGLLVS